MLPRADAREAEQIAMATARENGLRLPQELARRIVDLANGDRALMAIEIEKLVLYLDAAPEQPREATAEALDALSHGGLREADRLADRRVGASPILLELLDDRLRDVLHGEAAVHRGLLNPPECLRLGEAHLLVQQALGPIHELARLEALDHVGDLGLERDDLRSEERRVGKECRSRWSTYH